ncbi:hypothetical protein, partial [Shigella boydii]|uniref:hypothetical protein n=1 Tax=Shigella boydii TaxID=621 RepID=UPI003CE6E23A
KGEALEIPHSPEKEPVSCLTDWHYSLALAFFFYLTAVDRRSHRIRQKNRLHNNIILPDHVSP